MWLVCVRAIQLYAYTPCQHSEALVVTFLRVEMVHVWFEIASSERMTKPNSIDYHVCSTINLWRYQSR